MARSFFNPGRLYSAAAMSFDAGYDELDKLREECGVFGIWARGQSEEAANFTYLGLHALQHRGQESAGIVSTDGHALHVQRGMGLVADVFTADVLARLPGSAAIGHVRYSTAGASHLKNAQPIAIQYAGGAVAVAHNGNLINAEALRSEMEAQGSIFQTTSDTEVILHLMARVRPDRAALGSTEHHAAAVRAALQRVSGAYTLLFLTEHAMIGARDPQGFRPLVLGKLKGNWVLASETTALDLIEAEYVREVEPGEMVLIDGKGLRSERLEPEAPPRRSRRAAWGGASSSTSTSRGPTRSCSVARSTRSAGPSASSSPRTTRSLPTWSSPSPTPGCRPPSGTRGRAGSGTTWGSSVRTTSAGPSSSRSSPFATSA